MRWVASRSAVDSAAFQAPDLVPLTAALAGPAAMRTPARADELAQRTTGAVVKNGNLLISVGLQDLFGSAERQHLTSGLSTRVLIRVALQDTSRGDPFGWQSQGRTERRGGVGRLVPNRFLTGL